MQEFHALIARLEAAVCLADHVAIAAATRAFEALGTRLGNLG